MTDAHDIEQIARDMAAAVYGPIWDELGGSLKESFRGVAHAVILPLLTAAKEQGAKEMQERAVHVAKGRYWGVFWTTAHAVGDEIAALPLSPPPPKEG